MKNQYLALLLMPAILASSCEKINSTDNGLVCTEQAVSGLKVIVSLQNTTAMDANGISVIAYEGEYSEALIPNTLAYQLCFSGAIERKGNYIITVAKAGYKTFTSNLINVNADSCHVITQIVNVTLQKE